METTTEMKLTDKAMAALLIIRAYGSVHRDAVQGNVANALVRKGLIVLDVPTWSWTLTAAGAAALVNASR